MTITNANALFVDTNILIYASIYESPFHQAAQRALKSAYQNKLTLWISRQVLREYLVVVTRPDNFKNPLSKDKIVNRIHFFQQKFKVADDLPEVTRHLMELIENYKVGGKQIHDANIVATMKAYNITNLLTYNVSDFKRFKDIIQIESL